MATPTGCRGSAVGLGPPTTRGPDGRSNQDVVARAERVVQLKLTRLTPPDAEECLPCYLFRVVGQHGCDNKLTWTHAWQGCVRARRYRTGGLTAWLRSHGGYCDCEVLMNVYPNWLPEDAAEGVLEDPPPCTHGVGFPQRPW